jgi:hypothetical protein
MICRIYDVRGGTLQAWVRRCRMPSFQEPVVTEFEVHNLEVVS